MTTSRRPVGPGSTGPRPTPTPVVDIVYTPSRVLRDGERVEAGVAPGRGRRVHGQRDAASAAVSAGATTHTRLHRVGHDRARFAFEHGHGAGGSQRGRDHSRRISGGPTPPRRSSGRAERTRARRASGGRRLWPGRAPLPVRPLAPGVGLGSRRDATGRPTSGPVALHFPATSAENSDPAASTAVSGDQRRAVRRHRHRVEGGGTAAGRRGPEGGDRGRSRPRGEVGRRAENRATDDGQRLPCSAARSRQRVRPSSERPGEEGRAPGPPAVGAPRQRREAEQAAGQHADVSRNRGHGGHDPTVVRHAFGGDHGPLRRAGPRVQELPEGVGRVTQLSHGQHDPGPVRGGDRAAQRGRPSRRGRRRRGGTRSEAEDAEETDDEERDNRRQRGGRRALRGRPLGPPARTVRLTERGLAVSGRRGARRTTRRSSVWGPGRRRARRVRGLPGR